MSRVMRYHEDAAKRIVALSDTPEMRAQRWKVVELLAPQERWRVLDLGCGPGHLMRELAQAVGPDGSVCGVDVSEEMLAFASHNDIELVHVDGTTLPFDAGVFDAAVATQVYEFVEEIQAALAELFRVLRPGAKAVILDTDWDSLVWHSTDDARMRRVLDGWRERVADPHLPRTLSRQLRNAGFEIDRREVFAIFDPYGRADSYSARQIEHLSASAVGVPDDQINAWATDLRHLARTDDYFFSLNRYIFVASKPA